MKEYCRLGLGWKIFKRVCWCVLHGKPIKTVYYDANRMVAPVLLDKYDSLIRSCVRKYSEIESPHERTKNVWFCWMQGKDKMPDIVRACYNSQIRNIKDREFHFIDESNWRDYVSIPDYLVEKYRKGIMPTAMFTDLIRLELLIKYGGSWIDSTVLCAGGYDPELLDADIFMYQYGKGQGLSNWFITSCTNNPMLMVIRDVLHQYWKDYDVVLWEKHGVCAVGLDIMDAFDQVDVLNKAACIYMSGKAMGFTPEGMTDKAMTDVQQIFNLPTKRPC